MQSRKKDFQKKCDLVTDLLTDKVIYRGAPLPKSVIEKDYTRINNEFITVQSRPEKHGRVVQVLCKKWL